MPQDERLFPIMSGYGDCADKIRKAGGMVIVVAIPWSLIAPFEKNAQNNHGQSLARLAERGGLSAGEAIDVLCGNKWSTTRDEVAAHRMLIRYIHKLFEE